MSDSNQNDFNYSSNIEKDNKGKMLNRLKESPIPNDQLLSNLGLFITSKELARMLFMDHIFKQIVDVQGCVVEFGTRWGQNLALFSALRGIYDPFNRHRKIIGFDTFDGFPDIDKKDGDASFMEKGRLACSNEYEVYLNDIMKLQEESNPINHVKKFEVVKGDCTKTFPAYLEKNPHTIVALAYFDLDIYQPTKDCLEQLKGRLVKGSIVGFDELNDPDSPGETTALIETFGLNNIRLKRFKHASRTSYFVVE